MRAVGTQHLCAAPTALALLWLRLFHQSFAPNGANVICRNLRLYLG